MAASFCQWTKLIEEVKLVASSLGITIFLISKSGKRKCKWLMLLWDDERTTASTHQLHHQPDRDVIGYFSLSHYIRWVGPFLLGFYGADASQGSEELIKMTSLQFMMRYLILVVNFFPSGLFFAERHDEKVDISKVIAMGATKSSIVFYRSLFLPGFFRSKLPGWLPIILDTVFKP